MNNMDRNSMHRPSVSVVIRAFNESEHLGRLLAGLAQQTVVPNEIILVDSGSTDDTVAIAKAAGCRIVNIPKSEFSFGRSLNYGCQAASSDILLIVSAHVYPVRDTYVEFMLRPFSDNHTKVAYGRQIGDQRTKFSESRIMLNWFPAASIWDQGHPFSNNANAAVSRECWAEYRYDEELTGLEDLDFAQRVIAEGGQVAYVAESSVVHVHEETWSTIRNRYRREAIAYAKIVRDSDMSFLSMSRLIAANILGDYRHAFGAGSLMRNLFGIPKFRVAQFYGAWEGFNRSKKVTDELLRRFYYPADVSTTFSENAPGNLIDYSQR